MLRVLGALVSLLAWMFVAAAPSAVADQKCTIVRECTPDGCHMVKKCTETDPGEPGEPGSTECVSQGRVIPCTFNGGTYSSKYDCYLVKADLDIPPPPGKKAEDGSYYWCYFVPPKAGPPSPVWIDGAEPVDPRVLAQQLVASMVFNPIDIGIVPEDGPGKMGLVGMPVWLWVDNPTPNSFGPITASLPDGSISATARVTSIDWSMGDGTSVHCTSAGTAYADHYGKQASPTCGHRYTRTSSGQPDDRFTVTATSHWEIQWSGLGASGTMNVDQTASTRVRIGELQVLVQ